MKDFTGGVQRRTFLAGAAAWGAATLFCSPHQALAEPSAADKLAEAASVRNRITVMKDELENDTKLYEQALDELAAAQQAVGDAQARIDDATAKISDMQHKLGKRARSMYRTGQLSLLDFIVGAASFEELAKNWDLLDQLNEKDMTLVTQTKDLRSELQEAKAELERQQQVASDKADEAKRIKDEVEQTVNDLQALVVQLDAEAAALLDKEEESERQASIASARSRSYGFTGNYSPIPSQGSVVDYALSRIGCPYVWAAAGPSAFDCSGLVTWSYLQIGMSLPHQTRWLFDVARARLPVSSAQPGDVLWVSYDGEYKGHVGIACNEGGSHFVHAPRSGALVRDTDSLSWAGFTHALRF